MAVVESNHRTRCSLGRRAPRSTTLRIYAKNKTMIMNRFDPHERIFVPFKPDKNRRGREGNANSTYEFVGLQEVRPTWYQRGKKVNASFIYFVVLIFVS
ncbi:hypothetical protein ALC53_12098 [Atta colombica]|uniref:Uncharacterized protein n=1 Tax=Atta colombica TaxID=520822 RepID=A0A195AZT3_9HYME|nr:hypothetical protein ALC53_12098 [Atta colombica]